MGPKKETSRGEPEEQQDRENPPGASNRDEIQKRKWNNFYAGTVIHQMEGSAKGEGHRAKEKNRIRKRSNKKENIQEGAIGKQQKGKKRRNDKQTQQRPEHERGTTEEEAKKTPHIKAKQDKKREDERKKKETTQSERQKKPMSRAN